jgi:hypothetical protein
MQWRRPYWEPGRASHPLESQQRCVVGWPWPTQPFPALRTTVPSPGTGIVGRDQVRWVEDHPPHCPGLYDSRVPACTGMKTKRHQADCRTFTCGWISLQVLKCSVSAVCGAEAVCAVQGSNDQNLPSKDIPAGRSRHPRPFLSGGGTGSKGATSKTEVTTLAV